jgi:putative inorganic carbon (hco3(-)) transporter
MEFSKVLFIFFSILLFAAIPVLVKDSRRYFLCLVSFCNVFTSGWIFYHYGGLMLADLPVLCLLFLGLFTGKRFDWKASPVGPVLLMLVFWGLLTSFWATEQGWAVGEVTKHLRAYLVVVVVLQNIRSLSDLKLVVYSMLAGLLIQAVLGIYQNYFGALGVWFLGERQGDRVDWRAMGTFYVASFYANYLILVLLTAFRMFVYYRPPNLKHTVFFGSTFLLGVMALLKTYGRSQWIGFVIALGVTSVLSLWRSKFRVYTRWVLPVVVIFSVLFTVRYRGKILDQFGENRRLAYESRFVQWNIATRMIAKNPITGVGLSNYELHSWDYMTTEEKTNFQSTVYSWLVHNSYLLYAAEIGIPGALILVTWFMALFWVGVKILRAKFSHPFIVNTTVGILGGLLAFMIVIRYSPDIHEYSILYQLGLLSGILLAEWRLLKKAEWQKICSQKNGVLRPSTGSPVRRAGGRA